MVNLDAFFDTRVKSNRAAQLKAAYDLYPFCLDSAQSYRESIINEITGRAMQKMSGLYLQQDNQVSRENSPLRKSLIEAHTSRMSHGQ